MVAARTRPHPACHRAFPTSSPTPAENKHTAQRMPEKCAGDPKVSASPIPMKKATCFDVGFPSNVSSDQTDALRANGAWPRAARSPKSDPQQALRRGARADGSEVRASGLMDGVSPVTTQRQFHHASFQRKKEPKSQRDARGGSWRDDKASPVA